MNAKALVRPKYSLFLLLGLLLVLLMLAPAAKAAVWTNGYYFAFGDLVQINGDGMLQGETVALDVHFPDAMTASWEDTAVADEFGCFEDIFTITPDMPVGEYVLDAVGLTSGATFSTVFDPSDRAAPTTTPKVAGNTPSRWY